MLFATMIVSAVIAGGYAAFVAARVPQKLPIRVHRDGRRR